MQKKNNGILIVLAIAIIAILASIVIDNAIIKPTIETKKIEAEIAKEEKKQEKEREEEEKEIERIENLITTIDDIPNDVLAKANEYIMSDLMAKLSTEDDILLILGAAINQNPKIELSSFMNGYGLNGAYTDSYEVGKPKLSSAYLFIPKDGDTVGVLRFNYTFEFSVSGYGNLSMEKENYHTYDGLTANIPYYYYIDLSNKELPIINYSGYKYEDDGCDIDFDNWYGKNVARYKDNYAVEEKKFE